MTQQYYDGLAHEGQWLTPLTLRLVEAGIQHANATVDGGYTSFHNIALQWRHGVVLSYRLQEGWKPDREAALANVLKRYQTHRTNSDFLVEASLDAKLRFLVDHGSEHDIDAVGCYLRDDYLATRTHEHEALVKSHRSQNEGFNAEYKRLPITPARRGKQELLRRAQACSLTLHLVQLCRLQHGITTHLCRTAYFLRPHAGAATGHTAPPHPTDHPASPGPEDPPEIRTSRRRPPQSPKKRVAQKGAGFSAHSGARKPT